jgi:tight adherence protein B
MIDQSLLIVCGALILIAIASGLLWHLESRRRRISRRLAVLSGIAAAEIAARPESVTIRRADRRAYRAVELVERVVGRYAPLAAPFPVKTLHAVGIATVSAGGSFMFAENLLGTPLWMAVLAALAAFTLVPRLVCMAVLNGQRVKLLDQMPDALGLLVRAARTGMPISESVRICANEGPTPTADEFLAIANSVAVGTSLEVALEEAAGRTGMPEYRFFVTAIMLQRETGGSLAETLENLADVIRTRKAIRLKANALSAEARVSIYVLTAMPFFVLGILSVVNFEYVQKLFTPDGKVLLGVAGGMMILGVASMQMMVRSISR